MDLIDSIDIVPNKVTYLPDTQTDEPDTSTKEPSSSTEKISTENIFNKLSSIRQRIAATRTIDSDEDEEGSEENVGEDGTTQPVEAPKKSVLLPQLDIDLSDIEQESPSIEDRARVIAQQKMARRKLEERDALQNDISNVTLTDEEQDEIITTKPQTQGIAEVQKFLDDQKKHNFFDNIQSQRKSTKKFSNKSFVNDFEDEEMEDSGSFEPLVSDKENVVSSPITSPMKSPTKTQNPIDLYKRNLKGQEIDLDEIAVPKMTKDQEILVKQRFLKKIPLKQNPHNKKLFRELFERNIHQINSDPRRKIQLDEDEDEEIMENLLEKEIERSRRIRKQEKLREKAALALLKQKNMEKNELNDEEWAESDFDLSGEDDNDLVDDEAGEEEGGSDDENEDEGDRSDKDIESEDEEGISIKTNQKPTKIIDSEEDEDEEIDAISNSQGAKDVSFRDSQLFQNLKPHEESKDEEDDSYYQPSQLKSFHLSQKSQMTQDSLTQVIKLTQTINVTDETQVDATQVDKTHADMTQADKLTQVDETQADNTQADKLTQVDATQAGKTQVNLANDTLQVNPNTQLESTQNEILRLSQAVSSTQEDEITPESVNEGRMSIQSNRLNDIEEDEDEDEIIQQRIREYEEKIRKKELKLLKRRKEMERKGYKNIIEGEAEESEDEWAGIGGVEGEEEDRANSEDERMIDNNFNIDLNDEEIRKKFMEQYQIKDKKELEKLIDDIKNHKLIKKVGNGMNLELSDEEDEILMNYRKQKLKEQKQRLKQLNKSMKNVKSEKAQAFFESIKEDLTKSVVRIDEEEEEEEAEASNTIEETFIRNKLSFLSESFNQYEFEQRKSNLQHDVESDEDDLHTLKMKSFNNLRKRPIEEVEIETDDDQVNTNTQSDDIDFSDEDLLPKKKPSMIQSFRSAASSAINSFSGVTVSKQYKTASGSKSSIMFMSKKKPSKTSKLQKFRKIKP